MRHKKTSHSKNQSWGFLFGVVVSVTALSLLVLIMLSTGLTGFATVDPQLPSNISVTLDSSSYPESALLAGAAEIQLDGPLSQQTQFYATIDGNRSSLLLTAALEQQNIPYELSAATPKIEDASPATTLIYTTRGAQNFILRLPKSVRIQKMSMNLNGDTQEGSYPSFPKIDANRDGNYEWSYVGEFLSFNNTFILPLGLKENQENIVSIDEKNAYYCERITLPSSKDFLISAKYRPVKPTSSADLEAVLFSTSGSGDSIIGLGGTDVCDLNEETSTDPTYHACSLHLPYVISGDYLVCMHNAGLNLSPDIYYEASRDLDKQSGYRCGALTNGKTNCASQQGDFFIKAQQASYNGALNNRVLLAEGAPDALLPAKLNEQLQTCISYEGFCYLSLELTSESKGLIYLDGLDITYNDQGSIVHEKNFYTLSSSSPVLFKLGGKDLTQENYTLTLPLGLLAIATPKLSSSTTVKNYTLEVGLSPGPSVSTTVEVTRTNTTENLTFTGNFTDDVAFYQQVFTSLLQEHAAVLEIGGYKSKIEPVLKSLSQYTTLSTSSNTSTTSLTQLEDQIMDQIKTLPQYVSSVSSSSFTPSASASDFKDDYIYPQQRDEKSKQQLAYLQQQYAPTVTVETLEVVLFNKQQQLFTVVEHSTSTSFGSGKMIVIFPSSFASSTSSISFTQDPTTTLSASPLTVSWDIASLPTTMHYAIKGNLLSAADDLRVLFVPEKIPEKTEQPRTSCGDSVCSVLVSEGQKIYLEDSDSCPADCGGGNNPWMIGAVFLLLAVLLFYYFGGMYKGPWNFQEVLQRIKKGKDSKAAGNKLFGSSSDEANLRSYVQNALKKGVTKDAVTTTLLNRGWTKQQVDAVMKQVKP